MANSDTQQYPATSNVIIHVVQHLAPGGLETLVLEMLRFAKPEDSVYVISLEGKKATALGNWEKLTTFESQLHFLNKPSGLSLATIRALGDKLKILNANIVHTHHIGPLFYGGIAARLSGIKTLIHTEHDAWHLNNKRAARLQSTLLSVLRPQVAADANFVAEQLIDKLGYKSVETIHNGIDCEKFTDGDQNTARTFFSLPKDKFIIGTAGRLEAVKGQEVLLEAFSHLPNHTHLAIAGCGSQKARLEAKAQYLGIRERVTFLGLIEDMPSFYQSLDLFCLPSLQEGFPLCTLEAQACGVPCIASDVGAVKETLSPQIGTLVPPNQVPMLTDALLQQLSCSPCSPREYILQHFDIQTMVNRYATLARGSNL
ncbi:glycosyltransferase [Vibrio sp. AND4]|uniref:glycosyltransferase n=1 Tax=Vibrio sp. AND4 TaxID=314289 RepID=UPI00015EFB5B|nr:glycosyltransferase [Vibrio sp. AND4]EDP60112.1 putative glycosyl transferase [Vibrio sp. AND4]